jgi:hypothetical protein
MKHRLRLLGCLALCIAFPTGAAPVPAALDFALHLSRLDIPLSDGPQAINTTVKQLGIVSFDISQQILQPGLGVGYAYAGDSQQSVTAGMELEGFYIAPALRSVLLDGHRLNATLTATYLYQRVKDSNADQTVTQEWHQPQLDLVLNWRLSRAFALVLGGQYGRIDVDEKLGGAVERTVTLHRKSTLGYRAGLDMDVGGDGHVGVLVHRAIGDGVDIYFQQLF